MLAHIADDDLVHVAVMPGRDGEPGRPSRRVTRCGRDPVAGAASPVREGAGCHICLPDFAHPLAEVWATCRRWDNIANAPINSGRA